MILLSDAENRTIVCSFVWTKYRNVTERQTNGQTDRILWLVQRSALRAMRTRCKNHELGDMLS